MKTTFPIRRRAYVVPMNLSNTEEEASQDKILIDGYQVVFDKKIQLTPVELEPIKQTIISTRK